MKEIIKSIVPKRLDIEPHIIKPFNQFQKKEASSSIILIGAAVVALLWANSPFSITYQHFWETPLRVSLGRWAVELSLREWINEALMCVFFFTVGLEIKREILVGELSSFRKAILPVTAAAGGMLVPALIYYGFNHGMPTSSGWGIPMATDIAFALGVLYVLGKRVPPAVKVFLSALAIADDIGAVFIIALFYTKGLVVSKLLFSAGIILTIAIASYFWIRSTIFYATMAVLLWLSILGSGIHPTVAGILVAMFIPAKGRINTDRFLSQLEQYLETFRCSLDGCGDSILVNEQHLNAVQSIELACHHVETPLQRLEHALHPWVAYLIVPLFALANAGVNLTSVKISAIATSSVALGVFFGLLIGKPIGITLFTIIAVRAGISELPSNVRYRHIVGVSIIAAIGFTMSLFITMLSFEDKHYINTAKLAVFVASVMAGLAGIVWLYLATKERSTA